MLMTTTRLLRWAFAGCLSRAHKRLPWKLSALIASDVGRSQNFPQVKLSSRDHQAAALLRADLRGAEQTTL
jgi:hypothetical protein